MAKLQAAIFDAYGTLLDVHAPMAAEAAALGPQWPQISAEWRRKQLEYAWVRSLTGAGQHADFWHCTRDALDWVAVRFGIADAALRHALLEAYRACPAYAEVPAMLRALRAAGLKTAILSNGAPAMLAGATAAAGIDGLLDAIISVEEVGVFKPDPRVYALPGRHFPLAPAHMAFVSANPWDTQAALLHGFAAIRVNRSGDPDEYALRGRVLAEVTSLAELPKLLT